MDGQGLLGKRCAWCELPATREEQIADAEYDKKTGTCKRAPIIVPACDDHPTKDQPAPVGAFRRRKAKGVDQLDIFGGSTLDPLPTDAIRGGEAA